MVFRMNYNDCNILKTIAEYRILTPAQITTFYQKSRQVVWRRLRTLEKEGLIQAIRYEFGRGRGRPESLLGLTEHGVDMLVEKGLIGGDVPYDKVLVGSPFFIDHQLLLNWFRIHLNHVQKVLPRVNVGLFAHNSPFLPENQDGRRLITDYSPVPGTGVKGGAKSRRAAA